MRGRHIQNWLQQSKQGSVVEVVSRILYEVLVLQLEECPPIGLQKKGMGNSIGRLVRAEIGLRRKGMGDSVGGMAEVGRWRKEIGDLILVLPMAQI